MLRGLAASQPEASVSEHGSTFNALLRQSKGKTNAHHGRRREGYPVDTSGALQHFRAARHALRLGRVVGHGLDPNGFVLPLSKQDKPTNIGLCEGARLLRLPRSPPLGPATFTPRLHTFS